jgi:hypothetical protein
LAIGIAKHYHVEVTDADRASMVYGLDIELDHALHVPPIEPEPEVLKKKAQPSKKQLEAQVPTKPKPEKPQREEKKSHILPSSGNNSSSSRNAVDRGGRTTNSRASAANSTTTRDTVPRIKRQTTSQNSESTLAQRNSRLGSATKSTEAKKRQ